MTMVADPEAFTDERFPFAPIESLARTEWSGVVEHCRSSVEFSTVDLALRLGVPVSRVHQYRRNGLSLRLADRLAIELGTHPALVWPEQWASEFLVSNQPGGAS